MTIDQIKSANPRAALSSDLIQDSWLNKWTEISNSLSKSGTSASENSLNAENITNLLVSTGAPYILMCIYARFRQEFVSVIGHCAHTIILSEAVNTAMRYASQTVNQSSLLPKQPLILANLRTETLSLAGRIISVFAKYINQFTLAINLQTNCGKTTYSQTYDSPLLMPMALVKVLINELTQANSQGIGQFPSQELSIALLQDKGLEIKYFGLPHGSSRNSDSDSNQQKLCLESIIAQIHSISTTNKEFIQSFCDKANTIPERSLLLFQMYTIHLTQTLIFLQIISTTKLLNSNPKQRIDDNVLILSNQAKSHTVCLKQIRQIFIRWMRNKLPYLISNFAYNRVKEMTKASEVDPAEVTLCSQAILNHIIPKQLIRQIFFMDAITPLTWRISSKKKDPEIILWPKDHYSMENCPLLPQEYLQNKISPFHIFSNQQLTRILTDIPVSEKLIIQLLNFGLIQTVEGSMQLLSPIDAVDMACDLIFRAAAYYSSLSNGTEMTSFTKCEQIMNLLFNCVIYRPSSIQLSNPDPETLKQINDLAKEFGHSFYFWKVILAGVVLAAYSPKNCGNHLIANYPIIKILIESIISGDLSLLNCDENSEETSRILHLESCLLGLCKPMEMISPNSPNYRGVGKYSSTLLGQLVLLRPKEIVLQPPEYFIKNLREFQDRMNIMTRLCLSREPDFLLNILCCQERIKSFNWLSEFVRSNVKNSLGLPVQCLGEYIFQEYINLHSEDAQTTSLNYSRHEEEDFLRKLIDQIRKEIHLVETNTADCPSKIQSTLSLLDSLFKRIVSSEPIVRLSAIKTIDAIFSMSYYQVEILVLDKHNSVSQEGDFTTKNQKRLNPTDLIVSFAKLVEIISTAQLTNQSYTGSEFFNKNYPERLAIILRHIFLAVEVETDLSIFMAHLSLLAHIVIEDNKQTFTKFFLYKDYIDSLTKLLIKKLNSIKACSRLSRTAEGFAQSFDSLYLILIKKINEYLGYLEENSICFDNKFKGDLVILEKTDSSPSSDKIMNISIIEAQFILVGIGFFHYDLSDFVVTIAKSWFKFDLENIDENPRVIKLSPVDETLGTVGFHLKVRNNVIEMSRELRDLFTQTKVLPLFHFALLNIKPEELYELIFSLNFHTFLKSQTNIDSTNRIKYLLLKNFDSFNYENCPIFNSLPNIKKTIIRKKYALLKKSLPNKDTKKDDSESINPREGQDHVDEMIIEISDEPNPIIDENSLLTDWKGFLNSKNKASLQIIPPIKNAQRLLFTSDNSKVVFTKILVSIHTKESEWNKLDSSLLNEPLWKIFMAILYRHSNDQEVQEIKNPSTIFTQSKPDDEKKISSKHETLDTRDLMLFLFNSTGSEENVDKYRQSLVKRIIDYDIANLLDGRFFNTKKAENLLETFLKLALYKLKNSSLESLQKTLVVELIQKKYDPLLSQSLMMILNVDDPMNYRADLVIDFLSDTLLSSYLRFPLKPSSQLYNRPDELSSLLCNESLFDWSQFSEKACNNVLIFMNERISELICPNGTLVHEESSELIKKNIQILTSKLPVFEAFLAAKPREILTSLIRMCQTFEKDHGLNPSKIFLLLAYSRQPKITQVIERYCPESKTIIDWLKYPSNSEDICHLIRHITFHEFERLNSTLIVTIINQGKRAKEDSKTRFANINPNSVHQQSGSMINSLALNHPRCSLTFLKPMAHLIQGRLGPLDDSNDGFNSKSFNINLMNSFEFIMQFLMMLGHRNGHQLDGSKKIPTEKNNWSIEDIPVLLSREAQIYRNHIEIIIFIFFEINMKCFTSVVKHFNSFTFKLLKLFMSYLNSKNTLVFSQDILDKIALCLQSIQNFQFVNTKSAYFDRVNRSKQAFNCVKRLISYIKQHAMVKVIKEAVYLLEPIKSSIIAHSNDDLIKIDDIQRQEGQMEKMDESYLRIIPYLPVRDLVDKLKNLEVEQRNNSEVIFEQFERLQYLTDKSTTLHQQIFKMLLVALEKTPNYQIVENAICSFSRLNFNPNTMNLQQLCQLFFYLPKRFLDIVFEKYLRLNQNLELDENSIWMLINQIISAGQFEGIENICIENAIELIKNAST